MTRRCLDTRSYLSQDGFSLIEVLVALAVFAILAGMSILMYAEAPLAVIRTHEVQQAQSLAEEGLEAALAIKRADWSALPAGEFGVTIGTDNRWILQPEPTIHDDLFARKLIITEMDYFKKQVTAVVSWNPPYRSAKELTLSTIVTRW